MCKTNTAPEFRHTHSLPRACALSIYGDKHSRKKKNVARQGSAPLPRPSTSAASPRLAGPHMALPPTPAPWRRRGEGLGPSRAGAPRAGPVARPSAAQGGGAFFADSTLCTHALSPSGVLSLLPLFTAVVHRRAGASAALCLPPFPPASSRCFSLPLLSSHGAGRLRRPLPPPMARASELRSARHSCLATARRRRCARA